MAAPLKALAILEVFLLLSAGPVSAHRIHGLEFAAAEVQSLAVQPAQQSGFAAHMRKAQERFRSAVAGGGLDLPQAAFAVLELRGAAKELQKKGGSGGFEPAPVRAMLAELAGNDSCVAAAQEAVASEGPEAFLSVLMAEDCSAQPPAPGPGQSVPAGDGDEEALDLALLAANVDKAAGTALVEVTPQEVQEFLAKAWRMAMTAALLLILFSASCAAAVASAAFGTIFCVFKVVVEGFLRMFTGAPEVRVNYGSCVRQWANGLLEIKESSEATAAACIGGVLASLGGLALR